MKCKNCHTVLSETDDYCKSCGGRIVRKRLSFKNLFEHLSETFFNYDNKLLRTFVQLFKHPEDVINGYINGVRKKYINPISFFGLALTLSGISIFIMKKFYIQHLNFGSLYSSLNVPEDFMNTISNETLEYNSLIYSALVPLFALISWVVFIDKKYNLTEHIIIYLYSMSLISIVSVILAQIALLISPESYIVYSLFLWPVMFIYHCYILMRLFKLSFGNLLLRSLMFMVIFFFAYIIISLISFALMLATGSINLEDFKPKN